MGEKCAQYIQGLFSHYYSVLYIWVHVIQLGKEQVKAMQYTVGIKSRADGTKLLDSDSRFSN